MGTGSGLHGLWMLFSPASWYASIPGVDETGSLNEHFVRDVGISYLAAAVGLLFAAARPRQAFPAMLVVTSLLGLHALMHLWEFVAGHADMNHFAIDFSGVILPAVICAGITISLRRSGNGLR